MILHAYCQGIFPMADPDTNLIHWYRPDPRAVIPLDAFHCSRSLRKSIRQRPFTITSDRDFEGVMRQCAAPRSDDDQTWINQDIIHTYTELHQHGFAHSIEAYNEQDQLVGGLYGIRIRGAFFAESMFCVPDKGGTNASKICLTALVDHMNQRAFTLLDVQYTNPLLEHFGCVEITCDEYINRLNSALQQEHTDWHPFSFDRE